MSRGGGPHPRHEELDLVLPHGGGFVHDKQIMGAAAPRLLITWITQTTKLNGPAAPPEVLVLAIGTHGAHDLAHAPGYRPGLLDLLTDDEGV